MDMTIPSIILFGAMFSGLAMIPMLWREGMDTLKEHFNSKDD